MQNLTFDSELRNASPLISLGLNEASGDLYDAHTGIALSPSTSGTVLYGQASTLPGRSSVSLTYDASFSASDPTICNFDWNTPFWAVVRVQVNISRSNFTRAILFSKGTIDANLDPGACQGYCAYLHWDTAICDVVFQISTADGNSISVKAGLDLQNGNAYTLVFSYDGSSTAAGIKVWVEGQSYQYQSSTGTPGATTAATPTYPLYFGGVYGNTIANEGSNIHNNEPLLFEAFAIGSGLLPTTVIPNTIALGSFWNQVIGSPNRVPIIYDNDGDQDTDNLNGLAMLCRLHQLRYIDLLMVNNTTWNDFGGAIFQQILDVAGLHHIPVSCSMGTWTSNISQGADTVCSAATIAAYNATYLARASRPTDTVTYRKALAAASNNSVHIVCGGAMRGIYNLLNSPADSISALTGAQLFAQKVAAVHIQAYVPDATGDYNLSEDYLGAQYVFANNGSIPIYCYGTGISVGSTGPGAAIARGSTDPLSQSLTYTNSDTRASWDLWPCLGALDFSLFWNAGTPGTVSGFTQAGINTFSTATNSNHYQVVDKQTGMAQLVMNSLIEKSPIPRKGISK